MRRRPIAALLTSLALAVPLFAVAGPAVAVDSPSVRINEVEQNGDTFDWVELINTGTSTVDVSGWVLKDDKPERTLTIPAGTSIAAGGYLAVNVDDDTNPANFGLGRADTASVYEADGTTLVDTYSWSDHARVTWGRCADGVGEFRDTVASTKGAANACELSVADSVRINEVESNGDTTDWIELINNGNAAVDVSGLVIRDNGDSAPTVLPSGSTIAAGGFFVVEPPLLSVGLGGSDAARLFAVDGVTPIDSYTWTAHATTTYGRCPDGVGAFAATAASTKLAANNCTAPVLPKVIINEIESNGGTPGDWVELLNTGLVSVDLSGWIVKDSDDTHLSVLPAGSTIAAGGFFVVEEAQFGFGLGTADSVRVFGSDGLTLVDSRSWTAHSSTTLGLCGTNFQVTTSSTKAAANDCSAPLRINEVESNGDTTDWIELKNNGVSAVDVSGFVLKDNGENNPYTIAAGTSIPAGAYLVVEPAFGLGSGDSARVFAADGSVVDSYSWTAHATTTYGRCPDGTGDFVTTKASTKGTANSCTGDLVTAVWPGGASVTTVDTKDTLGGNMSGLAYEEAVAGDVLWAAKNGPGALHRLVFNGTNWVPDATNGWSAGKLLHYPNGTGDVDAEGVALTAAGASGGIFIASERNNAVSGTSRPAVLRYDAAAAGTELTASMEWNLTADLPVVGANVGLEAISWVPDAYLVAEGFVDQITGAAYKPTTYANHAGGLFFVGLEANGMIYAYALNQSDGSYVRVASFASGFPGVMDLEFEPETGALWAECDDTCQGRSATLEVDAAGAFAVTTVFERPTGMPNLNNEGFAITPQSSCVAGAKPVFWADDSNTDGHSIREGSLDCTVAGGPVDPTDPTEPGSTVPQPVPAESLTDATRGSVTSPATAAAGSTVTITVGQQYAGDTVHVWIYSTPTYLGAKTVSATGTVTVTIPSGLAAGAHRIAVLAADGTLIGWADIRVTAAGIGLLAYTGSNPALPLNGALLLLVAGAALLVWRRKAALE